MDWRTLGGSSSVNECIGLSPIDFATVPGPEIRTLGSPGFGSSPSLRTWDTRRLEGLLSSALILVPGRPQCPFVSKSLCVYNPRL